MYRLDYARGGFKMLPIADASGQLTSRMALIYAVLLLPLCLLVAYLGHAGPIFVGISVVLTIGLAMMAVQFVRTRGNSDARRLFFASIIYLPLLCTALMLDARGPLSDYEATPAGFFRAAPANKEFIDPSSAAGQRINAAFATATTRAGAASTPAGRP